MQDKIKEMRGFLRACCITGYLLPEQIALLTMGLNAMETLLKYADTDEVQILTEILENETRKLKEVSV